MVGGTEKGQRNRQRTDEKFPCQRKQRSTFHAEAEVCAETQRMERDVACSRNAATAGRQGELGAGQGGLEFRAREPELNSSGCLAISGFFQQKKKNDQSFVSKRLFWWQCGG